MWHISEMFHRLLFPDFDVRMTVRKGLAMHSLTITASSEEPRNHNKGGEKKDVVA